MIDPEPRGEPTGPVATDPRRPPSRALRVPLVLGGVTAALLLAGGLLFHHAASATNQVALAARPKGVTVAAAEQATFRASRRYVATIEPWLRATVGPQLVSAYVDTVLVRPGAVVKRGDVLATLDCRSSSASSSEVAMRARALEAKESAMAKESARVAGLLKGGFVSPNEVEQKEAEAESLSAQILATKAKLAGASLEVSDCVLRAPFPGEIARRLVDPGAFVRPGQSIVDLVDRSVVRVSADVPESDFEVVAPGVEARIRALATGKKTAAKVARRAPAADLATRTIHVEIDLDDPDRTLPVGTSAEVKVDAGAPVPAVSIPLAAATVRGSQATLFVVTGGAAHQTTARVVGEDGSRLFLDPAALAAGAQVVLEGRALLNDGDMVEAKVAETPRDPGPTASPSATPTAGPAPAAKGAP
ncbi:MAG: efflux RND transporter periplasmic adaptor subunit [Byssovorax sp.]